MPVPPRRRAVALAVLLALVVAACSERAEPDATLDQHIADPADGSALDRSGTLASGASWRVVAPDQWNGTLLLYSHGAVPPGRANPAKVAPDQTTTTALLQRGFALAGSSYARAGWAVDVAVPDQVAALDAAIQALGRPTRTLAWGSSLGGLVTVGLVEQHPDRFDGGVALCGVVGGSALLWDTLLDVGIALKVLLAPLATMTGFADDGSSTLRLLRATGRQAQPDAAGRARLALAAALGAVPGWSAVGAPRPAPTDYTSQQLSQVANLATLAPLLTSYRADLEEELGGNPSSNVGVDHGQLLDGSGLRDEVAALYRAAGIDLATDLATLDAAPPVAADPVARDALVDALAPTGRIEDPLLLAHTTGDPFVPVGHLAEYAALVGAAGRTDLLRATSVERAGHCSFTVAEQVAALELVADRVDAGRWPDTAAAALDARAAALPDALQKVADPTGSSAGLPLEPGFTDAPPRPLPRSRAAA